MVRGLAIASRNWQTVVVADLEASWRALSRVHPRTLQVLLARFVAAGEAGAGRAPSAFAAFYGVSDGAAGVLLWRAAREFEAAVDGKTSPAPEDDAVELRDAQHLARALLDEVTAPPRFTSLAGHLRELTRHAEALRQRLADAERAELSSPAYVRETWLRRIAIVIVLALSAWFYWRAELTAWWSRVHPTPTSISK